MRHLSAAGLDFEIDHPTGYTTTTYTPRLTKRSSGAYVAFSALSSGEKVLMAFALCLYYSIDTRQSITRPALLLFDEIDAPLHPSMCRTVVSAITDTLVAKYGVKVIMATHSPSTVAVAPEDAVFSMESGQPGLRKVGKRQAITLLTADIPTLSITFDGRRQVLVESASDAERYDALYRLVSGSLDSERSLVFIGAGKRKRSHADDYSGCDQVRNMVGALVDAGNASLLGLLDWDTRNDPDGRVLILARGERYAIENLLLDPLLVAAMAIREDRKCCGDLGMAVGETFSSLSGMQPERLQEIVDIVQCKVLELSDGQDLPNKREVAYMSGLRIAVSSSYLQMPGHKLEERVKEAFPRLKRFHNQGQLILEIIDPLLVELPGFIPESLNECFRGLLNTDVT